MPNVFSPRGLISRPDNMDETVLHTCIILNESLESHRKVSGIVVPWCTVEEH